MKHHSSDLQVGQRFVEASGGGPDHPGSGLDQRIGQLLRQVPPPPALPATSLARVAVRLGSPPAHGRRGLRLALIGALILGSSSAVYARRELGALFGRVSAALGMAGAGAQRPRSSPPRPGEQTTPAPIVVPPPRALHTGDAPPVNEPPARAADRRPRGAKPARVAMVERRPGAPAGQHRSAGHVASPTSPPRPTLPEIAQGGPVVGWQLSPPPSPALAHARPPLRSVLGAEAQLIREALQSLRQEGQAQAALDLLDEHRARYPAGLLQAEAELLRVEVLVALNRPAEALPLLEELALPRSPRGAELQALRGELRAGRSCARARADFDELLARPVPSAVAERALRGRTICLLRRGGVDAARSDLRRYLARFPGGPFAERARALLGSP